MADMAEILQHHGFTSAQIKKIVCFFENISDNPFSRRSLHQTVIDYFAFFDGLDINQDTVRKMITSYPLSLRKKFTRIDENLDALSKQLGIAHEKIAKSFVKNPRLFWKNTDNLLKNAVQTTLALCQGEQSKKESDMPVENIFNAFLGYPTLWTLKPQIIVKNVFQTAQLLGVGKNDFLKACLKHPTLFSSKPTTIYEHVSQTSTNLNIPMQKLIACYLKYPTLFSLKPERILSNARENAKNLNASIDEIAAMYLIQPPLFYTKPEEIKHKYYSMMHMYLKGLFRLRKDGHKINPQTFRQYIFNSPDLLNVSRDNLHIKCAYARYMRDEKKQIIIGLKQKKQQLCQILLSEPSHEFIAKNQLVYWILCGRTKRRSPRMR